MHSFCLPTIKWPGGVVHFSFYLLVVGHARAGPSGRSFTQILIYGGHALDLPAQRIVSATN